MNAHGGNPLERFRANVCGPSKNHILHSPGIELGSWFEINSIYYLSLDQQMESNRLEDQENDVLR